MGDFLPVCYSISRVEAGSAVSAGEIETLLGAGAYGEGEGRPAACTVEHTERIPSSIVKKSMFPFTKDVVWREDG